MLTKERTSKSRKLKYAAVAIALLAVLVFCFASCGKATPTGIEYVTGSAKVAYNAGETFDCTGAQVKVTYSDGTTSPAVDVTPEMVGNAPLTLGTESVVVTYSENGATVVGHIPVTVNDPNAQLKADSVKALNDNATVAANKADMGVDLLIRDYTAKINAATSADAISAVVANFEQALDAYLADKADVLAKFEGSDLTAKLDKLYAQFAKDIASAMETAKANISAASTIDEAEAFFTAFVAAVDNKLAEQEVYEGNSENKGQIYDKIDLLELIEAYQSRTDELKAIVKAAKAAGEITQDEYNAAMSLASGYGFVEKRLSWWNKYITLAIDLSGVKGELEEEIGKLLETPVDKAATLLQAGTTIYPTAYKLVAGAYVDDVIVEGEAPNTVEYKDATDKLIKQVKAYYAAAEDIFGATGLKMLKRAYGVDNADNALIDVVLEKIEAAYAAINMGDGNTVVGIRAAGADIVALIEEIAAMDVSEARDLKIADAWVALKAWGTANGVFSLDTTITTIKNNLVYDKAFENVIYEAELLQDVWAKNFATADDTWTGYDVDMDYVVKYYIPNLEKLIEATEAEDARKVKEVVALIPSDIIFSYTDADANRFIVAAQNAIDAYKDAETGYGEEVYKVYFVNAEGVDEAQAAVDAARAKYDALVEKANKANAAIDAYENILATFNENAGRDVKRSDYEASEAPLKAAYKLYCEFAAANTTAAGVCYTDVIQDSKDATTGVVTADGNGNEEALIEYMVAYVELAYDEERHVQPSLIIYSALKDRLAEISTDETDFRVALTAYAKEKVTYIGEDSAFNIEIPATVTIGEGADAVVVTLTQDNAHFYFEEILAANIKKANSAAEAEAEKIATFAYGASGLYIPGLI